MGSVGPISAASGYEGGLRPFRWRTGGEENSSGDGWPGAGGLVSAFVVGPTPTSPDSPVKQTANSGAAPAPQADPAPGDNGLPDQEGLEDQAWFYQLPPDSFTDPDGEPLTYAATLANGDPLPTWLVFDSDSLTFAGTPPPDYNGTISILVTAKHGETTQSSGFALTIVPVNDSPDLSVGSIYSGNFEGPDSALWSSPSSDGSMLSPLREEDDGTGNVSLVSEGPWWLDLNHIAPGGGELHLPAILYVDENGGSVVVQDLRDVTISFDIKAEGLVLPEGAHLHLWFQALDPKLAWGVGQYVNYVNTGIAIDTLLIDGAYAHVTITLSQDEADWLALGSSLDRDGTYSKSASILDALSADPVDMGLVIFMGNQPTGAPASGLIRLDNVVISHGDVIRLKFAAEALAGDYQPLHLDFSIADPDTPTFEGYRLSLAYDGQGLGGEDLALFFPGGELVLDNGALFQDGVQIGTVGGGQDGAALLIDLSAPVDASILDIIVGGLAYRNADAVAGETRSLRLTVDDGHGGTSALAVDVIARLPVDDGSGDDHLIGTEVSEVLNGGGGDDRLEGAAGDDRLDGGAGDDILQGGTGDDFYYVDSATDVVIEVDGEGSDRIFASASYVLGQGVDVEFLTTLSYTDLDAIDLTGNELANIIFGNSANNVLAGGGGNDVLDGGAGFDTLLGGTGDDLYRVDSLHDLVLEEVGEGSDGVITSVSYALAAGAEVELLTTDLSTGLDPLDLTGNEFANRIYGNAGSNRLDGGAGNDLLDGGAGADILQGGTGDDFYYVDSAADVVIEEAGEGTADRIFASVSYVLADGVDVEILTTSFNPGLDLIDLTGNELANLIFGNAGANSLSGAGGADTLVGNEGDDILDGGAGIDVTNGGLGDDWHYVDDAADRVVEGVGQGTADRVLASVSYVLSSAAEVEFLSTSLDTGLDPIDLTGNDFGNTIIGNAGANILKGGGRDDVLDGGAGDDVLQGGTGEDVYHVDSSGDVVIEGAAEGVADRVLASVSYVLPAGAAIEFLSTSLDSGVDLIDLTGNELANTILGNAGANSLNGDGGADLLVGNEGDDILDGGAGIDVTNGGLGDDWHYVDSLGDVVIEGAGEGDADRVLASTSYVLAAGVEVETLSTTLDEGLDPVNLTGNELANAILGNAGANALSGKDGNDALFGNEGNDVLDGGAGIDITTGGLGDDWHFVDSAEDVVVEAAGEGSQDRVFASASYVLSAGAEVEIMSTTLHAGTDAINLTGNEFANVIYGNAGANSLKGGGGNDTLVGNDGNDILDGGAGSDVASGGTGDDWYFVDGAGDVVTEAVGDGTQDRVFASANYALAAGVEVEIMSTSLHIGTDSINLTGNEFANIIYGNAGANALNGGGGNDILNANEGNDILDGGVGADILRGGTGDDWYYVDSASDVIFETVGEGALDRVFVSVSYTLGAGVSVEMMSTTVHSGLGAINLTGNELANIVYGNAGANALNGKGGDDTLVGNEGNDVLDGGTGSDVTIGGLGDDWHFVDSAGDVIVEAAGEGTLDRVFASTSYTLAPGAEIEMMSTTLHAGTDAINLTGNDFANLIYGNAGANVLKGGGGNDNLIGNEGNDMLDGGAGDDFLQGGTGSDTFVFSQESGTDRVLDFATAGSGHDLIGLSGFGNADLAAFVASHVSQRGADAVVSWNGAELIVANTSAGALTSDMFVVI